MNARSSFDNLYDRATSEGRNFPAIVKKDHPSAAVLKWYRADKTFQFVRENWHIAM